MKLKFYHTKNTVQVSNRQKPTITIRVNGKITFAAPLVALLNLEGKKVAFAEDEERKSDWYLALNHPEGFKLKPINKESKALSFQNKMMADRILKSIVPIHDPKFGETISIPVSLEPDSTVATMVIHALITKAAFVSGKKAKDVKLKAAS